MSEMFATSQRNISIDSLYFLLKARCRNGQIQPEWVSWPFNSKISLTVELSISQGFPEKQKLLIGCVCYV